MPEGLVTPAGQKLGTAPASPDTSAFEEAIAAAAVDKVLPEHTPPKREKPVPAPDEAARIKREAAKPKREARPRTAPSTAKKPAADLRAQRVDGVKGLVQIGAVVCLAMDQRTPPADISFQADALVLVGNAEAIATAVADTCDKSERFAAIVDRVTEAGPYAALVAVAFSVGAQIARNHGVSFAASLGTVAPEQIVAQADLAQAA